MATGSATGTGAAAVVDVVGTTSVTGEDSADVNGTDDAVVVDGEDDVSSGAYVVTGCSISVPDSIGSGLDGSPLQSTRYG